MWRSTMGAIAVALMTTCASVGASYADEVMNIRFQARDVGALDPALTKTGDDETVALQIFNSLVAPPRGTLDMSLDKLQPQLAERWEISDDFKTWTFYLRPGVKWQKGYGEVSAEDVKFSYERQKDPALAGVHGASFKDIESIEVVDPLTVRFHLKSGNALFHSAALVPGFGRFVVPKRAVEELGDQFRLSPVGSGPFEFAEYRPQQSIVLKAFDEHFAGRPPMDELRMRYIPDNNAGTIAFIGGELDVSPGERTPQWVKRIEQAAPNAKIVRLLPGSVQFLSFNMKVSPLDDPMVRQAIAHGINRQAWSDVYGVLHGDLPTIVPEEFYGALPTAEIPSELTYSYDPERAKALLAEAGHPDGFSIDAIISEREDYLQNMLMVQDMLRVIGVNLNLKVIDHASYHANIRNDQGTVVELSTAIQPTAPAVLNEFLSEAAAVGKPSALRNFSHYGEVGGNIDDLVSRAVSSTDENERLQLLKDAQLQVLKDLPVLPLQTAPIVTVMQGDIDLGYEPVSGYGQYEYATAKRVED